ncbi:META domain-containing protein [Marinobacter sp. 1Y8]
MKILLCSLTLGLAVSVLSGCATSAVETAPDGVVSPPPLLQPGSYSTPDGDATWVLHGNHVYERATGLSGDQPQMTRGLWQFVPGTGQVILVDEAGSHSELSLARNNTLMFSGRGDAGAVALEYDDDADPIEQNRSMDVCFMTMADAPLAYDPRIRRNLPVAMDEAYPALEAFYRKTGKQPPERTAVTVQGHWVIDEAPDSGDDTLHLRVASVEGVADIQSVCPGKALQGTYWSATKLGEIDVTPEQGQRELELQLNREGKAAGFAGCNRFSGDYVRRGDHLALGPLASTRMMCPARSEIEAEYFKALDATRRFAIEGDQLYLMDDEGRTVVTFKSREIN